MTTFFDQFSKQAIKKQYAKNAVQLAQMADKARKTGKYNGFTFDQLEKLAADFKHKSLT